MHIITERYQWIATGWWFSLHTPVSSTNKTDHHDITEILLKVPLNTIDQTRMLFDIFKEFVCGAPPTFYMCIPQNFTYLLITIWRSAYLYGTISDNFWRSYCPFLLRIFYRIPCTCKFSYILNGNPQNLCDMQIHLLLQVIFLSDERMWGRGRHLFLCPKCPLIWCIKLLFYVSFLY